MSEEPKKDKPSKGLLAAGGVLGGVAGLGVGTAFASLDHMDAQHEAYTQHGNTYKPQREAAELADETKRTNASQKFSRLFKKIDGQVTPSWVTGPEEYQRSRIQKRNRFDKAFTALGNVKDRSGEELLKFYRSIPEVPTAKMPLRGKLKITGGGLMGAGAGMLAGYGVDKLINHFKKQGADNTMNAKELVAQGFIKRAKEYGYLDEAIAGILKAAQGEDGSSYLGRLGASYATDVQSQKDRMLRHLLGGSLTGGFGTPGIGANYIGKGLNEGSRRDYLQGIQDKADNEGYMENAAKPAMIGGAAGAAVGGGTGMVAGHMLDGLDEIDARMHHERDHNAQERAHSEHQRSTRTNLDVAEGPGGGMLPNEYVNTLLREGHMPHDVHQHLTGKGMDPSTARKLIEHAVSGGAHTNSRPSAQSTYRSKGPSGRAGKYGITGALAGGGLGMAAGALPALISKYILGHTSDKSREHGREQLAQHPILTGIPFGKTLTSI